MTTRSATAYLSLGSNLGPGVELIGEAVRAPLYRTSPVGPVPQPDFTNSVISIETDLAPEPLMGLCHEVERDMGRNRSQELRWGPRRIDIDLIAYGNETRDGPDLILPHPRFAERAFVLVPLNDLAPDVMIGGHRVRDYLARLDRSGVEAL
ncbi:MAG: 2-amino-4-hydroxy-6-hydroxymethyldihydropteridine diphosphokinase [Hyphomicrobiales bacterium]|nr:2-amino-4-hydroxy-6-hydroxymethyldihydropteridine diphosphokinase [Hyphomicrobiales bacterium]